MQNSRDALGDDEHGRIGNPSDVLANLSVGRHIDRAGGVIKNEHARMLEQCACDAQALLLATRDTGAALAQLAVESADDPNALTLLIPRANDKGFAMTGSYSCMTLLSTLIFDTASDEQKAEWVETIAKMGEEVIARESEVADYLAGDFNRVTYLGSGSFGGLAQESQLKILELAHGLVATSYDTSMGYRHGPKSFVDDKTLVFVFVNNDAYTRQYDIDILNEIGGDKIAQHTIAVQQEGATVYEGESFTFKGYEALPEGYLALPFVMFAQAISLLNSVRVGNTPDTPSPTGTVNRVVKGVTIHPFTA